MSDSKVVELYNNFLITNGTFGADIISPAQTLDFTRSYCVQFGWSGASTPVGTFALEGTNDDSLTLWTQITDSLASVSGASGSIMVNVELPAYKYVRIHYTSTSGTGGTVNATIHGKQ